jgi:chorismate mutase
MTTNDVALSNLRRQIDEIDDQIHDLMMRRAEIVIEVGKVKGPGPMVRPAREAEILRRLVKRNKLLPVAALLRIWREMIVALTSLEGPISVAVYLPDNDGGYWDLARDYYGATVPLAAHQSPGAVLRAVSDQPGLIGILPWPREDDADPWWRHLSSHEDGLPRIVARLPFITGRGRDALVVAQLPSSPSGDDRSLMTVEIEGELSRTNLLSVTKHAGFAARYITSAPGMGDKERVHLFDVAGFVAGQDPRLAKLVEDNAPHVRRAVVIGTYATPIEEKPKRRPPTAEPAPQARTGS